MASLRTSLPAACVLLLVGCPDPTPCPTRDAGVIPDAPSAPDVPAEPVCTPPPYEGRPVVYAHGPARTDDPTAPTREFLAVIDTELRQIVEYVPVPCAGGGSFLDLAVAADGTIILSGGEGFVRFDPTTSECTVIRRGIVHNPGTELEWFESVPSPNNLTFVPPGVLDPTHEVMAAFGFHYLDEQRYYYEGGFFRYDADDAVERLVFEWPDSLTLNISGDLVVVTDYCTGVPRAYMTMIGDRTRTDCHPCRDGETPGVDCGDCLYSFDVQHGVLGERIALLPDDRVYGLALFGDTLYGFSEGEFFDYGNGRIFAITAVGGSAEVAEIPVTPPDGYRSIHFNGAGSTSAAPILF